MADEPENDSEKSSKQPPRQIPALPGESLTAYLERISQMPRREGESIFVEGAPPIGPIIVTGVPQLPENAEQKDAETKAAWSRIKAVLNAAERNMADTEPKLSPEENEENFRIYMERRRRMAQGLPPGPVTEEHFRPKKS